MNRVIIRWVFGGVLLSAASISSAAVITFEDVASGGCLGSGLIVQSGGFSFALGSPGDLIICDSSSQDRLASNGTNYLSAAATQGTPFSPTFTMTSIDGSSFSLASVDFAELFRNGDFAEGANATGVNIIGTLAAGGFVNMSVILDGFNDGTGAGADFETFLFGAGFSGLSSVDFVGTGAPGFSDVFNILALDNIVATTTVPEPSSLALLGLGLCGLGMAKRRKKV